MTRFLIAAFALFLTLPAYGLQEWNKQDIPWRNILNNGGFEGGKRGFTATGGTFSISTSTVGEGLASASWDSSGASQHFYSTATPIPAALYGKNCALHFYYNYAGGSAGDLTFTVDDGSTDLLTPEPLPTTSGWRAAVTNFICPSSGNIRFDVASTVADPTIAYFDKVVVAAADAVNIGSVSQATFVGGAEQVGAAGCSYAQSTSSGVTDWIDLGTGTGCNAWTVAGPITAVGTNDHRMTYTAMPAGEYDVIITGAAYISSVGTANFRLSDGTTAYQSHTFYQGAGGGTTPILRFHVSVSTPGTKTFKVQSSDNTAVTTGLYNDTAANMLSWKFNRFPLASEQAYRPDMTALSWSGSTTLTGSNASATIADFGSLSGSATETSSQNLSCSTTSGQLGVDCVLPQVGVYEICFAGSVKPVGGAATMAVQLADSANTAIVNDIAVVQLSDGIALPVSGCGQYTASASGTETFKMRGKTTASSISFTLSQISVKSISQSTPAPILVGGVTSSSAGAERVERATINGGNPPTIASQSGSWLTYSSRTTNGEYNWTMAGFSTTPTCVHTVGQGNAGMAGVVVNSATSLKTFVFNSSGTAIDYNSTLVCMGPR